MELASAQVAAWLMRRGNGEKQRGRILRSLAAGALAAWKKSMPIEVGQLLDPGGWETRMALVVQGSWPLSVFRPPLGRGADPAVEQLACAYSFAYHGASWPPWYRDCCECVEHW
jgi:hypothetical protein